MATLMRSTFRRLLPRSLREEGVRSLSLSRGRGGSVRAGVASWWPLGRLGTRTAHEGMFEVRTRKLHLVGSEA